MSFLLWIFVLSVLIAGGIFYAAKENMIKKESTRKNSFKVMIASGIVAVISLIGFIAFPSSSNNDKDASESSSQTSKQEAKNSSSAKDKKELEYANSMASSLKNEEKPKFANSIGKLVDPTKGTISNAVVKNGIVYITLDDSVTDNQTDSGLKQDCNTIYHAVNDIAAKHGLDKPSLYIYDSGNNTIAKNTALGGYKYIGLGK